MPRRILIVEDNPVSAKMLELHLWKHGYEPLVAQTGR
jgi:DNA-binding response OmpR family regulator